MRETKFLVDIGPYLVAVEVDRIEPGHECIGERRLAGARQAHDEDLLLLRGRQAPARCKFSAKASLNPLRRHGLR